jgi:hypothetical protein
MTIAVAVRTNSAVVFAADSKVTTAALAGFNQDGTPRWLPQTYDNAVKVARDLSGRMMAMVAGHASIGETIATDFITTRDLNPRTPSVEAQTDHLWELISQMVDTKRSYWATTPIQPDDWPGPVMLLAAPAADGSRPRVWRIDLSGPGASAQEILQNPYIRLEGSFNEIYSMLYGRDPEVLQSLIAQLNLDPAAVVNALDQLPVLLPINKLSLTHMPIQDAIDLAVFLATVQVEMDRFLPDTPACGGPIDVMVLLMAPEPGIVSYPGKVVHHPSTRR